MKAIALPILLFITLMSLGLGASATQALDLNDLCTQVSSNTITYDEAQSILDDSLAFGSAYEIQVAELCETTDKEQD